MPYDFNAVFGYVRPSGSVGARYHVTADNAEDLIAKITAKISRAPANIKLAARQLANATSESEPIWDVIEDGTSGNHWQFKFWRS